MNIRHLILPALVLAIVHTTHAQITWQRTNAPYGISSFATMLVGDDNHIYLGTVDHLYRSTDEGSTWSPTGGDAYLKRVLGISQSGEVYALGWPGIFKTSDGGDTWTGLAGTNSSQPDAFLVHGSDSIYAVYFNSGGSSEPSRLMIDRSTDAGKSWLHDQLYYDAPVRSLAIEPRGNILGIRDDGICTLKIDKQPLDPTEFVLRDSMTSQFLRGSNGMLYAGAMQSVYRSIDSGITWKEISLFGAVSLAEDRSGNIYALSDSGLYRTSDNGEYWARIAAPLPGATMLRINTHGDFITNMYGRGAFVSSDTGQHWSMSVSGIDNSIIESISVARNGNVIINTWEGIYRSTDRGDTWLAAIAGLDSVPNEYWTNGAQRASLIAQAQGDPARCQLHDWVYEWKEDETAWSRLIKLPVGDYPIQVSSSSTFMAGHYRTIDAGATWDTIQYTGKTILAANGDLLEIRTDPARHQRLYRSTDAGKNWVEALGLDTEQSPYLGSIIINQRTGHLLLNSLNYELIHDRELGDYGIYSHHYIFKSIDNGITWMKIDSTTRTGEIAPYCEGPHGASIILIHPAFSSVFASYPRGIYQVNNQGKPALITETLPREIYSLAMTPDYYLLCGYREFQ